MIRLFDEAKANIAAENELFAPLKEQYEAAMAQGRALVEAVVDVDTANENLPAFRAIEHALTSKKELMVLWNTNAKQHGLFYDKVLDKYTPAPPPKEGK